MPLITTSIRSNTKRDLNFHVSDRVIENLCSLIPQEATASEGKMNTINFAVSQLCKASEVENIDWVALFGLATNICALWKAGCLE